MDDEICDLHQKISNLLNEAVGRQDAGAADGDVRRMSPAERRLLAKARQACGPYAGGEWRKAAC